MMDKGKYVDVQGIQTHYHEEGKGEPLLLIHGSGPGVSAWANWRLVFPILSRHYHLYAPDVVGFGYTERPENIQYSVDLWVEHMIAFIETMNLRNVSIIGNSMGGALALHVANRRPDLVKKIILMGSTGIEFPITAELDAVWGYTPSIENMKKLISIFSNDQSMAENDNLVKMRYESSIEPGFQEAFSAMFPAPRQRHVNALALTENQLSKIEIPILLIHGREDRVIPLEKTNWKLSQIIPNAELHVFPNCGHWVQIEKTEPFIGQVIEFLKK
ncbi:alpha/beta hydrolase [Bacillus smithii]|uniref:alpha/beta fold hydrolase n=2 Tax=Bacillus smithii TaxID=1479 RepID=UPI00065E5F44|nr:alpha/beta hydrolase [Bacillus smithii]AKP47060.1 2-hydroxymuconic semialdehyde hydrolase [Bacillus smithii]MED4884562.1 alpha/beta hydrolase [Bacillus smithii]MED4927801.1 alpha/beta hydrolase [Bacillus smithii]